MSGEPSLKVRFGRSLMGIHFLSALLPAFGEARDQSCRGCPSQSGVKDDVGDVSSQPLTKK